MNILAVGAHFDDVELGCSGTLMNHINNGDNVTIIVVTDSSYTNPEGKVIRDVETAVKEGKASAKIIGCELICLNFQTFYVRFDEDLTQKLTSFIEKLYIDTVYCHWTKDLHRDHRKAAQSTIMASRHIPRVLMYRSNYYDTGEIFNGNFYSDITDSFEKKIDVIKAHESELERVRYKWIDFIKNQNSNDGQRIGVKYAEKFEVVRYLI